MNALRIISIFIACLVLPILGQAEGTRELKANDCANEGDIQIWDNGDAQRQFATWNCATDYRLNIRVNSGEVIHLGFKQNNGDVWYRLKDPSGSIVLGPTLIASGNPGWIGNCSKALIGPKSLYSGGYNDETYTALVSGDYYVEFAVDQDPNKRVKRVFKLFDITVSQSGTEIKGRVWSKAWDLTTNGGNNRLMANFYAYSNDSIVTKFEFNGIRPYGFVISCNSYGASDVGTLSERRKSDYRQNIINAGGTPGAPEYPLFLNEPDVNEFPSGTFGVLDSFQINTCYSSNCVNVWTTKPGQVETTLRFENGSLIQKIDSVNSGLSCIDWNGKDGLGNDLAANDTVWVTVKYINGITHLPLIDVEHHEYGYTVSLVRPLTKPNGDTMPDPLIFWNDSLLTDPENSLDGIANLTGAQDSSHRWHNRGTSNSNPEVINTWWYSSFEQQSYILICPVFLDIELEYFWAQIDDDKVMLEWKVNEETELRHYILQRSTDGLNFENIDTIQVQNGSGAYRYYDSLAPPGDNYYRLQLEIWEGSPKESDIALVHYLPEDRAFLFWDAKKKEVQLKECELGNYQLQVFDLSGKLCTQMAVNCGENVRIGPILQGIYILRLLNDRGIPLSFKKIQNF